MSKKVINKKNIKKSIKEIKKLSRTKLIVASILIILVAVSGFFVFKYYSDANQQNNEIVSVTERLATTFQPLGGKTDKDLFLPLSIPGHSDISITWISSEPNVITDAGIVNRPLYKDGDKEVVLTANLETKAEGFKLKIMSTLGYKKETFVLTITVKSLEPTDDEKIDLTIADLIDHKEINRDINLLKKSSVFSDVMIEWTSSNPAILSEDGLIKGVGEVALTVKVSVGDKFKEKTFNISVIDTDISYLILDEDFESYAIDNVAGNWSSSDNLFKATNGKVVLQDNKKVLNINATNFGSFEFLNQNNEGIISLSYQYLTPLLEGEMLDLKIEKSINNEAYSIVEIIDISKISNNVLTYEFTFNESVKLSFISDSANLEVNILNVVIKHYISEENLVNSLEALIPKVITSSINLPITTVFGGTVSWESSNPGIISSEGIVNVPLIQTEVTLTATIMYFEDIITYSINLKVGQGSLLPSVYVYFIDLGKYGQNDLGEAMMIKLGDYEVMIDSGDNKTESKPAVLEAARSISSDKVIELVVATHPHADHIGNLPEVFSEFNVLNLLQFEGTYTSGIYNSYVNAYKASSASVTTVLDAYNNVGTLGRIIELGEHVFIEIYNTGYYKESDANTRSIIFVLEAYGTRVLFTGDGDNNKRPVEASYMNLVGDVDILKVVHHGTKNGTTTAFLEAVTPEVAIITNGNYLGNANGHPTPEAINRIYQYNNKTKIYSVTGGNGKTVDRFHQRNGMITIEITNNEYYVRSEYYNDVPIELSSTDFWMTNPNKAYSYVN